jgi:heat shock protein HslJ
MKKTRPLIIVLLLLVALAAVFNFVDTSNNDKQSVNADYKNTTYTMPDGTLVSLVDGVAETESAPGSASKIITRYFGNELFKDLNDDGRDDVVFLVTQEMGGSGTYFYVVAVLNTENGYIGSHALLLGDRIAPQTIESGPSKQIIVNYADRAIDEPMTTSPSVGKSLRLILDIESMQFGEVANNFEGEADPQRMTLDMKTWVWQKAEYNDGRTIVPSTSGVFTLTLSNDGSVAIGTDCNNAGGDYTAAGGNITFTDIYATLMYCEGSQETEFLQLLGDTATFHFTSRGELVFGLKYDSGTVTFR